MKLSIQLISLCVCVIGIDSEFFQLNGQAFKYFEKGMSENKKVIGFNLNQNFGTNSLTSAFVLDFVNGKFINDEQKDKCIANFDKNGVVAAEQFNLSLNYKRRLGNSNNYLFFEAGETFFYESKMHEDIFKLIFKGNKEFENKTASLVPLKINSLEYFYLKGGFHKLTEKYTIKVNLAYVGGQRFLDLNTMQGGLFTATDGRFIDLNLKLKSLDVNPKNNSLFDISGNGLLSDLMFTYNLSRNSEIGIGVEGLGYINWNKNVTERIVDTLYHFEGEEISNVLDSFSIAIKNADELKSSFIKERENVKYKTNLPYIAYIQLFHFLIPNRLQLQLKYGVINSEFSKPFFNSAINFYFSSNKLIGLNIDEGGYGKLNVGGQFALNFSNESSIHIYFNSISNLLLPSAEMSFNGGLIYRKALN